MPKKNLYLSDELDRLAQAHGSVPFSALLQRAVERYLRTAICPTCQQEIPEHTIAAVELPPRKVRSATKTTKAAGRRR